MWVGQFCTDAILGGGSGFKRIMDFDWEDDISTSWKLPNRWARDEITSLPFVILTCLGLSGWEPNIGEVGNIVWTSYLLLARYWGISAIYG